MKNFLLLAVVFFLLGGCAVAPTQDELASADYGAYPSDYKDIVQNYMETRLKDPMSAQYSFLNSPRSAWNTFGGKKFGYAVCARVNAKNSFGGYTGGKLNYFLIRNGSVILMIGGDGEFNQAAAEGSCKSFL